VGSHSFLIHMAQNVKLNWGGRWRMSIRART